MLGFVFTSFVDMLEQQYSVELADNILSSAQLKYGGAYTAVGYYADSELLTLFSLLSEKTALPQAELLNQFGQHLFHVFLQQHSSLLHSQPSLFDLLAGLDQHIHKEVRKLYPKAVVPAFTVMARTEQQITLAYDSPRKLHYLAIGLIEAAAEHYHEPVQIELLISHNDCLLQVTRQ